MLRGAASGFFIPHMTPAPFFLTNNPTRANISTGELGLPCPLTAQPCELVHLAERHDNILTGILEVVEGALVAPPWLSTRSPRCCRCPLQRSNAC